MNRSDLLDDALRHLWYAKEAKSSTITRQYGDAAVQDLTDAGAIDLAQEVDAANDLCNPALYEQAYDRVKELIERERPCSAEFPCHDCPTCDRVEAQRSTFGMYS